MEAFMTLSDLVLVRVCAKAGEVADGYTLMMGLGSQATNIMAHTHTHTPLKLCFIAARHNNVQNVLASSVETTGTAVFYAVFLCLLLPPPELDPCLDVMVLFCPRSQLGWEVNWDRDKCICNQSQWQKHAGLCGWWCRYGIGYHLFVLETKRENAQRWPNSWNGFLLETFALLDHQNWDSNSFVTAGGKMSYQQLPGCFTRM